MHIEVDGRPAAPEELVSTYGHFTAMQVRGGRVQGFAHHLERLDLAHRELFDRPLPGERVRDLVRHALHGTADASVRVVVRDPEHVAVLVDEPHEPPSTPQRLRSVPYLRPFAHLKHLGGFAQIEWARRVRSEGYDDALLIGRDDEIAESTIANIGFLEPDGTVVWPAAPHLRGIAMRLVQETTTSVTRRVTLADIGAFRGAFLTNSIGLVPVASVDGIALPDGGRLLAGLTRRLAAVPWDQV